MSTYYFPIKSSSLAHYFGGACIKAARYFNNKPQDIQDRYEDYLLLTDKKGTKETDCCLEVVLTKEEITDLIDVKNGWYLLDTKPLPITRIKKIYFSNKEQMDNTITNIRMSTAFVPTNLLEVCAFDVNPVSAQVPPDCQSTDQTDRINQYDKFLGALALMRLAHEPYMNYSPNYFATLSFFNRIIENSVKLNENMSFNNAFQGIFTNSKGFEKVLPYLKEYIDEDALNKIAKESNQIIKKDTITKIIDVESITDTWTYTIAILNAYGVGDESRKKRIDGLIQSNFKDLRDGKQEGVALCYGYNRGYSAFTKDYGNVAFKFKLESQLDYYTIESVYQYVFNGKVSSDFLYLDNWCPKLQPKRPKRSTEYVILDELIIGKKKAKVFSTEWWNGCYQKFEKDFGRLSGKILEIVKPYIEKEILADIKDEIQESFQDELDKKDSYLHKVQKELETAREELEKANLTINQLNQALENAKTDTIYQNHLEQLQGESVVAEPTVNYGQSNCLDDIKIAAMKYKDSTLDELKKRSKPKAKDTCKLSELLLNQPNEFNF